MSDLRVFDGSDVLMPTSEAEVIEDVMHFIKRFVSFSNNHQLIAVALWTLHTYVMEAAESTPYLQIHSPEKRSGKTRLLEALELLVYQPWRLASPTEPVLFRKIAKGDVTLLLDEYDAIFKDKHGNYEGIRAILNQGYRRGSSVWRCVGEGTKMDVKEFPVFCPKALSGIGQLPDTVGDRSIPIELKRRGNEQPVERFIRRRVEPTAKPIREKLRIWANENLNSLMDARPRLPDALNDRAADGWEPLFASADLIGGDWPKKARKAALALHSAYEDESPGVLLLTHIKSAFEDTDRLLTAELLTILIAEEEGPWGAWWGADVQNDKTRGPASKLARMLKPYDIRPKTIRVGSERAKGYERSQFKDSWKRYLTSPSPLDTEKRRDNVTPQADTLKTPFSGESEKEQNKGSEQACHVVTSKNADKTCRDEDEDLSAEFSEVVI